MRTLLHIFTRPEDEFINEIIRIQEADPNFQVRRITLMDPDPDYDRLLLEVFHADSIHVW
jgi:hypothetical protein